MSRIARLAACVAALMSLFAALSSTAGAVTWHNTGSTSYTATGGPITISRGSVSLSCSGSTATGTYPGGSIVAPDVTYIQTVYYSPCTLSGQNAALHCVLGRTGYAFMVGIQILLLNRFCETVLVATGTKLCVMKGTSNGSYTNPSGATHGRFTDNATAALTVTNSVNPCPLGTGSGSMTHETLTVTGGSPSWFGPVIDRTP